ncbi:MAG: response regulator, partial [Planctomycetales bacterium]|nr:response regulator [Planctomycetales bacterium]
IEAGKMELEEIEFDLRQVVVDAVKLMSAAATKKQLELLCDVTSRAPATILGDPSRLRQIIVNLVGNAIKFTETGEVRVTATVVPKLRGGLALKFAVSDTGPGIPKDKQQHVFGAFQQSDGSTTRKYGGTGLGLSISSELVSLMSGRIWLESEVGVGTTFFFEIPLVAPGERILSDKSSDVLADVSVLAYSGYAAGLQLYAGALQRCGATVTCASDAAALQTAAADMQGSGPRVAVIDLAHADPQRADAVATWRAASHDSPWKTIWLVPVDWLSADAAELPGTVLTKPVLAGQLSDAVQDALSEKTSTAQSVPPVESQKTERALRVLLVDDSPVNRQVGVGLLEIVGHSVTTADDGFQALEALESDSFDVVLMDLEMPGMDGLEATRQIRAATDSPHAAVPIIAMTAHAVSAIHDKCLDAGMNACLTKPVRPAQLFAELDKVVVATPVVKV